MEQREEGEKGKRWELLEKEGAAVQAYDIAIGD